MQALAQGGSAAPSGHFSTQRWMLAHVSGGSARSAVRDGLAGRDESAERNGSARRDGSAGRDGSAVRDGTVGCDGSAASDDDGDSGADERDLQAANVTRTSAIAAGRIAS